MLPFDQEYLNKLDSASSAELALLDAAGFIPGRDETFEQYRERLGRIVEAVAGFDAEIDAGPVNIFAGITLNKKDRIPAEIISEVSEQTSRLYGFAITWAPGFFLSQSIGLLWGGCAITDTDKPLTIFLIRNSFRNKKRWFIYNRLELMAHELCHTARCALRDHKLEEFFAYQTAPSRVRRYLGNCFISKYDALLFLFPVLILLGAQVCNTFRELSYGPGSGFPVWPFWVFALACPVYLLMRNHFARRHYLKARKRLSAFGFKTALPILFRCDWVETGEIAGLQSRGQFITYVDGKAENNLRWKIIRKRFILTDENNP